MYVQYIGNHHQQWGWLSVKTLHQCKKHAKLQKINDICKFFRKKIAFALQNFAFYQCSTRLNVSPKDYQSSASVVGWLFLVNFLASFCVQPPQSA